MAIIKCPHCKKQTISTSDKCINCGKDIISNNSTVNTHSNKLKFIIPIIIFILIVGITFVCMIFSKIKPKTNISTTGHTSVSKSSTIESNTNTNSNITDIILSSNNITMTEGDILVMNFVLVPDNIDKSQVEIKWESANSSVVTVENGTLTAIKEGDTTIIVSTPNNITSTCHVVVEPKQIITTPAPTEPPTENTLITYSHEEKYCAKALLTLKKSLKNPDSLYIHSFTYNNIEGAESIFVDASGENGFGGTSRSCYVVTDSDRYVSGGIPDVQTFMYCLEYDGISFNEVALFDETDNIDNARVLQLLETYEATLDFSLLQDSPFDNYSNDGIV